ncbi:hypothetical protein QF035_000407 [Streptomyces umbrinus]|uniref:Uncharacterized protein n=1 Tax=Streptomyces umbrinus TaxID=67370 RepID=A0ABU0SGY5_9ACTN|nr:hypothetical protein [Streptomyces umbrinus]MDQ1022825.1 hypothetical protein [Streptomyces umbrinus]
MDLPSALAAVPPQRLEPCRPRWKDHRASARPGHSPRPTSYISPDVLLPDGRSYLDRTTDTVIEIVRARHSAPAATDGPLP